MNKIFLLGFLSSFLYATQAFVSSAPEDDLSLTLKAINSAKNNLSINIYEFTSTEVSDAIIKAIGRGVDVDLLQEGQIVGGISEGGLQIQQDVLTAMDESGGNHHYYEMTGAKKDRRYAFDHAKYIVIDNKNLLIGSENYSPAGQPSSGAKGNRGWEVFLDDKSLVNKYLSVFKEDSSLDYGDVEELESRGKFKPFQLFTMSGPGWVRKPSTNTRAPQKVVGTNFEVEGVTAVTSPDTSLKGLLKFIKDSKKSLQIQQMTLALKWGGATSPLVNEILAAARRGVKVQILLNNEKAFGGSAKEKNRETIDFLNQMAEAEDLEMEGRIADLKDMGVKIIHNKGALADGNRTLVSSINWNQNAVENNREAAVVIESGDVNQYYLKLFNHDWKVSEPANRLQ